MSQNDILILYRRAAIVRQTYGRPRIPAKSITFAQSTVLALQGMPFRPKKKQMPPPPKKKTE